MKRKKNLEDVWLKWIALFCFGLRARAECFVCWERVLCRERLEMKSRGQIINAAEEVWGQGTDSESSWRGLPR